MARRQKIPAMNVSVLALDFGARRIGLAAASTHTRSSSTVGTIKARGGVPDWPALEKEVREWGPELRVSVDSVEGRLAVIEQSAADLLATQEPAVPDEPPQ